MPEITETAGLPAGGNGTDGSADKTPFWIRIIQGAIIGVGAVLPGISGGVLATMFGIQEPMISVFAHPKTIKKYWKTLLPVAIGIALGFLGLAKLVEMLFLKNESIAVSFFAGLIAGTVPSAWKAAGRESRNAGRGDHPVREMIFSFIAFAMLLSVLMFFRYGASVNVVPSAPWFALCGFFMALCMVVPGIAAPTILLFLGLYEPLMELITGVVEHALGFVTGRESFSAAFSATKWPSVLFFGAAFIVTLILVSKPVDLMIRKLPSSFYHVIFGIIVASVIPLLPYDSKSAGELVLRIGCIAAGFAASYFLGKLTDRYAEKDGERNGGTEGGV